MNNKINLPTADIDGALIIADGEAAGANVTLDYLIHEDGSCTCKLCGELTASRTHWYRHKYKVTSSVTADRVCNGAVSRCTTCACSSATSARSTSRARRGTKAT